MSTITERIPASVINSTAAQRVTEIVRAYKPLEKKQGFRAVGTEAVDEPRPYIILPLPDLNDPAADAESIDIFHQKWNWWNGKLHWVGRLRFDREKWYCEARGRDYLDRLTKLLTHINAYCNVPIDVSIVAEEALYWDTSFDEP